MSTGTISSARSSTGPGSAPRRTTNITLPESLLRQARELNINLSQACEHGLSLEVEKARSQRWLDENRIAIEAWNDHVERNGLPLADYRQF